MSDSKRVVNSEVSDHDESVGEEKITTAALEGAATQHLSSTAEHHHDNTMQMRCLLSWSSGKDCAYALHILRRDFPHIQVVGLLTTFNETNARVAMHATRLDIALAQAYSVGLPLWRVDLPSPCTNTEYVRRMAALHIVAKSHGITHVAFGDLHLREVRA